MSNQNSCGAVEHELLADLVDGSLDAQSASSVNAHLTTCPSAQVELSELRALHAAAFGNHLETSEIVSFAWDGVPPGETHLEFCSTCREEVEAVRAARPPQEASAEVWAQPERRPVRSAPPLLFWQGAIAAVLVAGVGIVLLSRPGAKDPSLAPSVNRGVDTIDNLQPAGSVARGAKELVFSWGGPRDLRYGLSFLSADGRLIRRVETLGNRWTLTGAHLELLERESEFFWKVEALDAGAMPAEKVTRVAWQP